MSDFLIAYLGGNPPTTPEDGALQRQRWQAWLMALGDAVVNPGTPLMSSRTISSDGEVSETAGTARLTGFSVVKAADLDAALAIAKSCPFLDIGGTIEVAKVMTM